MFSENTSVIEYGIEMVYWVMPFYAMYGVIEIMSGAIKAIGRTMTAMFITFMGTCAIRIVYLVIVDALFGTLTALLIVYPFTWLLTSATFALTYRWAFYIKNPNS